MKRLLYFVLIVVVVGVIAYYVYEHRAWLGLGNSGGGVPTEETNTDLEPAHVSWHAVNRIQDGFNIDMPSDSSEIQIPAYNVKGGAEEMDMLVATPNAETTYGIAWDDNPRWNGRAARWWNAHSIMRAMARWREPRPR